MAMCFNMPTQAREVFDVSGAGDTVIASLGVMLASGSDLVDAVRLANRAAGIVVGKLGTAVVERARVDGEHLMYIVVTGAAGFVGANLVKALKRARQNQHHRCR